jgi:AbrB family looped-hinge helix DNA binding protein
VEVSVKTTNYVMKVSSNGQVSIPAEARSRWQTSRVVVVDLGDRIVMRPLPADPIGELHGKYRNRGLDSESARRDAREDDARNDRR